MATYQTLSAFLAKPFGNESSNTKLQEYAAKYEKFMTSNKIVINKIAVMENSFYYHIKVPSESQPGVNYDVVIRFFTDDASVAAESNLQKYYIQFFSNSPSFIYQYAYVYKEKGYLIKTMYDKLDKNYINVAPEKTNASLEISFDKSIYFACRYLSDKSNSMLSKNGAGVLMKRVHPSQFFRGITDVESLKIDQLLLAEEKKLTDNIKDAKKSKKEERTSTKEPKKTAETFGKVITPKKKITPASHSVKKITPKKKI